MADPRANDPAEPKKPPKAGDRSDEARKHTEKLLDEALKETFPASDPPSIPLPQDK